MKRFIEKELEKWKNDDEHKPLILRGARQVGKSTLVRQFCAKFNLKLFEINFEIQNLVSLSDEWNFHQVMREIESKCKMNFQKEQSLIFFDEIQESKKAIMALRYFYEHDPSLMIIAAGSLLEFLINDQEFSMPVGRVQYLYMGPMTFFEFLDAMGEETLARQLEEFHHEDWKIHEEKMYHLLRSYYFVGGMPEAVKTFVKTQSAEKVKKVHQSILQTYRDDFSKYKTKIEKIKINGIFDKLPFHLGKKIIYSKIMEGEKSYLISKVINLFIEAKILLPVYHSNATTYPIRATEDDSVLKLYWLDIGLYHSLLEFKYEDFLASDARFITEGISAEQFVCQQLYASCGYDTPPRLHYNLKDKKNNLAEIDFLLPYNRLIIPLEVKAGKVALMKSLLHFIGERALKYGARTSLQVATMTGNSCEIFTQTIGNENNLKKIQFKLINIPIYLVEKYRAYFEKLGL